MQLSHSVKRSSWRSSLAFLLLLSPVLAQQASVPTKPEITWHNLSSLPVEGKGWADTKHLYDRLPARAEGVVRPPVWSLAQDSAGLRYRFVTDAESIQARWKLRKANLALPHMAATGVSGLDLYVRDNGKWHWLGVGRPTKQDVNENTLVKGLKRQKREYLLYLPLYNGVDSVEIGLPADAVFEPAPNRYTSRRPVLFYGTSILQGGCASRPGMAYPSIIGRMLDISTINLGFSGNGKTEPEMAKLLAELNPAVYLLDSLPNLTPEEASERLEPFVKTIRDAHPRTPIILVEHVTYTDGGFVETRRTRFAGDNEVLRKLFSKMKSSGDKRVYYVPTAQLLGSDGEGTVDGTHPTDLGFLRMAEGIAPTVKEALQKASQK